ncbi:MAG: HAMP domain-containing sensor histidine kinase [Clostridia bacterium]
MKSKFSVKLTAVVLFAFFTLVTFFSLEGVIFAQVHNFYSKPLESALYDQYLTTGYNKGETLLNEISMHNINSPYQYNRFIDFSENNCNMIFSVTDDSGKEIYKNYTNSNTVFLGSYEYSRDIFYDGNKTGTNKYTISFSLKTDLTARDDFYYQKTIFTFVYNFRNAFVIFTVIGFLICSAGHKSGITEIQLSGYHKIPLDLYAVAVILFAFATVYYWAHINFNMVVMSFFVCLSLLFVMFFLSFCMTFAARCKVGHIYKNTIIWRILLLLKKIVTAITSRIKMFFSVIPFAKKSIALYSVIMIVLFFGFILFREIGIFLWVLLNVILIPIFYILLKNLLKLKKGGEAIANGDFLYRIDTKGMLFDFKKHGENLNSISENITKAVNEKMKSEHLKTELITNVSHDIKTPLTSIINYVDLIAKQPTENESITEYILILQKQSARLKKLIEDLVEASKASTGNITVNLEKTELDVLLVQTVGEYEERLAQKSLELKLSEIKSNICIMADGRLIWRVIDNLMNNICKYSQPSTRVYLDLKTEDNFAYITFKNISSCSLNISSDELLERFVRGDSSRHTEGSGLGLSIAKSLTTLQNGNLELYVDGDLFKVVVSFPLIDNHD